MENKNNFYTILPSNSCPLIHPENEASNFIVEFENSIRLEGDWEVALLDFTFLYSKFRLYSKAKIEYVTGIIRSKYFDIIIDNKNEKLTIIDPEVDVDVVSERNLFVIMKYHDYALDFTTLEDAAKFGFTNLKNDVKHGIIPYHGFKKDESIEKMRVQLWYTIETEHVIHFHDDLFIPGFRELNTYLLENTSRVFKNYSLNKNELFKFQLVDNIKRVTFDSILVKTFGLDKQVFVQSII